MNGQRASFWYRAMLRSRPGYDLQVAPGDQGAALVENAHRRNRAARPAINDEHRLAALAKLPAVAPLPQSGHHRDEVLSLRGELVFVARPVGAGVYTRQHAAAHQMAEAAGEDVPRDRKLGREVGEPARSQHGLADNQKRPPVPNHFQSSGDRTILLVETVAHPKSSCIRKPDLQE